MSICQVIGEDSYILKKSMITKSLMTPGIVRSDEPNEILVEIFPGSLEQHVLIL